MNDFTSARVGGTGYTRLALVRAVGEEVTRTQAFVVMTRAGGFLLCAPGEAFTSEALDRGNAGESDDLGPSTVVMLHQQGVRGQQLQNLGPALLVDVALDGETYNAMDRFINLHEFGGPQDFTFAGRRWPHGPSACAAAVEWIQATMEEQDFHEYAEEVEAYLTAAEHTEESAAPQPGPRARGRGSRPAQPRRQGGRGEADPSRPQGAEGAAPSLEGSWDFGEPEEDDPPPARVRGRALVGDSAPGMTTRSAPRRAAEAAVGFGPGDMFGFDDAGDFDLGDTRAALLSATAGRVRPEVVPRPKRAATGRGQPTYLREEEDQEDPLVRLADLLSARRAEPGDDLFGLDRESGGSSTGVRGAAQRDRFMQTLIDRPGTMSAQVMRNMRRRLGRASMTETPDPQLYLERFGGFADARETGLVSWSVARILESIWTRDAASAADRASLLLVALEQAALDRGSWDLAWILTMQEDPPQSLFARQGPQVVPRAFSALANQTWATAGMAYLRELDTLQSRREELSRARGWNPRWRDRRRQGQEDQPQPPPQGEGGGKGDAKGKTRKGKEKGD